MKKPRESWQQYRGTSGPLPAHLVDKAERLFVELIASSAEPVLVHGDLHHDNVLSAVWSAEEEGRGWEHAISVAEVLDTITI